MAHITDVPTQLITITICRNALTWGSSGRPASRARRSRPVRGHRGGRTGGPEAMNLGSRVHVRVQARLGASPRSRRCHGGLQIGRPRRDADPHNGAGTKKRGSEAWHLHRARVQAVPSRGNQLFLKGTRCLTEKCAWTRASRPASMVSRRGGRKARSISDNCGRETEVKRIYGSPAAVPEQFDRVLKEPGDR